MFSLSNSAGMNMTADEYLWFPDAHSHELVKGQLVRLRPKGDTAAKVESHLTHFMKMRTTGLLVDRLGALRCFDHPNTVRRFSICIVIGTARLPQMYFKKPPDLAIDVIGPQDLADEVFEKAHACRNAGFPRYWQVYPHTRTIDCWYPDGRGRRWRMGDLLNEPMIGEPLVLIASLFPLAER